MPRNGSSGVRWISDSLDIKSIKKTGSFFRGRSLLVWVSSDDSYEAQEPLVGIVAGKGFGTAVKRNLAKRRVRCCILEKRQLLKPGTGYLVECRAGAETEDYQNLVMQLETALSVLDQ